MAGFSVKKPLTIFVTVLGIIVLGVVAYLKMTPDLLPNMDFPYVIIVTSDPGASPESIEQSITRPVEQSMATLDKIKTVTSTSQDSASMVTLEFEDGANMDTISVDIQQKISVLQGSWDDTVSAPYVLKINPSMLPVMVAAVSREDMDVYALSEYKEIYGRLDSGEYTIEHIMPQKLTPVWISELKDDAETIHSDWLHRLANLTLTAYNSKYSNSPFSEKKTMQDGYLQSGIKMNQRVAQKEHWGLAELEERCGYLTQQAIQLWPYAASSYTPPQKQYDEVALDDEINLTGRTLVKYRFRGMEHDTTSWAEMYAAVLKELHNADKSYLNYLADADDSVELSIHVGRTAENYSSCVKIDEDIYVWTGTATQYKINLLRKFFEQYKQDPSDLVFFLDDAKDTGSEDEAERHKIRRKYWEKALPLIQKTTGSFQNANPQKNNAVYGGTNKPGVLISCVANFDSARVEIYIDQGDYDKNRAVYRLLETHRSEIETAYGKALTWVCQEGVRGCRIYDKMTEVSITKEDDWDAMIAFHTQQAKKLLSAMQPFWT